MDVSSREFIEETTSRFPGGDFREALDATGAASTDTVISRIDGLPTSSAVLVVKRGPDAGSRFLLDRPVMSAGRHDNSNIFLDDVTVSRHHAEFRSEDNEVRVVDVGSLNGTYVNHEPVDSTVLADHDEVQIGKFRLLFLDAPNND